MLPFNRTVTHIASADESGMIKYTNNLMRSPAHQEAMRGLSFSPDDARLAPASHDSTVRVRSFPEGREEHVLPGHGWDVKCVEWHPTMGLFSDPALESGSRCCMCLIFCLMTYNKHMDAISPSHRHKNMTQSLAWAPNGNLLTSVSRNQTTHVLYSPYEGVGPAWP